MGGAHAGGGAYAIVSAARRTKDETVPCWRGRRPEEKLRDRRAPTSEGVGMASMSRKVVDPAEPASSSS